MPNDNQNDPTKSFTVRYLPWILGLGMLVVYLATLNRWVTLANILPVSKVSGFLWQPDFDNPLLYLVLLPFRLLPVPMVPLAMNVFSALCAAAALALLARCVAILPHDRTEMERTRERSDFSFLTTGSAWLVPLLAVMMLGLQFGFWQNATSFTSEMVNLLLFAVIVWLLLEFRLDEREGRLTLAALIYGAGMADNWALIAFLPVFLIALIWLRGFAFFNVRFLVRMALCGLAGMSLYLLLPIIGKLSGGLPLSFWEMLTPALRMDWLVIKAIRIGEVRHNLLLMSVTTLVPLLVMSIRWSANFGDNSHMGTALANYMFHIVNAVIFGVCVWIMFDPPFCPSALSNGASALPLYFLAAIAVGYYAGYYLLVFGKKAIPTRRNAHPLPSLPKPFDVLSPLVYWSVLGAAGLMVFSLAYKNLPQIRAQNDDTLLRYAQLTEQTLPRAGGILLTDSEGVTSTSQTRTLLMQCALARSGRGKDFLVVDTQSLNWAPYHRYLHQKSPDKWPKLVGDNDQGGINPLGILGVLNLLSQSNNICYLNPSFGYYFEIFYQEPNGLVYPLKKLPEDTLLPPPLPQNLIAENQKFWASAAEQVFPRLEKAILSGNPQAHMNIPNWIIMHLHGLSDPNPNALFAASLYSRALNFWGVQLQRAGHLPDAAQCFAQAQKLNPDNIVAGYNLEFNQILQSGLTIPAIDPSRANADQFGKYRNWNALLNANGPFDEPSFVFANAALLAQSGYMRQSIAEFTRVRQLAPDNLSARLTLANLYLMNRLPDPALDALQDPLTSPKKFGLTASNSTELNVLASAAYLQKNEVAHGIELLEREMARHPDDMALNSSAAQAFMMRGLYSNALQVINRQLARTPDDPQWIFGKGLASLQSSNYNQAITSFSQVLLIATNDPAARFNRALAYLQSDRLNEARADYLELQTTYTNGFQIAYGLAEVARRQKNTSEAIHNYQIFLANAPTNAVEIPEVRERLKQLQPK
jgi:tetratricopeptide (TPR) repeat protein